MKVYLIILSHKFTTNQELPQSNTPQASSRGCTKHWECTGSRMTSDGCRYRDWQRCTRIRWGRLKRDWTEKLTMNPSELLAASPSAVKFWSNISALCTCVCVRVCVSLPSISAALSFSHRLQQEVSYSETQSFDAFKSVADLQLPRMSWTTPAGKSKIAIATTERRHETEPRVWLDFGITNYLQRQVLPLPPPPPP